MSKYPPVIYKKCILLARNSALLYWSRFAET